MRKLLFTAVFLIINLCAANAQEETLVYEISEVNPYMPRHEMAISYGIYPVTDFISDISDLLGSIFTGSDGELRTSGAISLAYSYFFTSRLGVGGIFSYAGNSSILTENNDEVTKNFFSIMPQVKYIWLQREIFSLYSRIGVGVSYIQLQRVYEDASPTDRKCMFTPMAQLSPIGIEVGRRFAGYAELGWGSKGLLMLGIRARF